MRAASSPTNCLSMPTTDSRVFPSRLYDTPSGGRMRTGCENPTDSTSSPPSSAARYPTPWISRSRLYPSVTPTTMLFSSVRVSPCRDRCSRWLSGRSTTIVPLSFCNLMRGLRRCESAPFGPLTVTMLSSAMSISTAAGIVTGMFPIRDIAVLPRWTRNRSRPAQPLEDRAEDLAADSSPSCLVTGHDSLRCAYDRNSQATSDAGDVIFPGVDSQTGFADPFDLPYRRLPVRAVTEGYDELILRPFLDHTKVRDVALFPEDFRYRHEHLGRRHCRLRLPRHPGISNPGQHVADRVVDAHPSALLTVSYSIGS